MKQRLLRAWNVKYFIFLFFSIYASQTFSQSCPPYYIDIIGVGDQALVDKYDGDLNHAAGAIDRAILGNNYFSSTFGVEFNIIDHVFPGDDYGRDPRTIASVFANKYTDKNYCFTKFADVAVLVTGHSGMGINGVRGPGQICPRPGSGVNPTSSIVIVDRNNSGSTFLHEIMHSFGFGHIDCNSGEPCADECKVQSDGSVKLFCCCNTDCNRHGIGAPEKIPLPTCLEDDLRDELQRNCDCLSEVATIPENCAVCENNSSIQLIESGPKIPGCSGKEIIEYNILVCNDCKASENVEILFNFPAGRQTILDSGPLVFDAAKSSSFTTFYSLTKNFDADECIEFTIKAEVVSGGNIGGFSSNLWTWFKTDANDYDKKKVFVDAFSNFIELSGDLRLSNLINNNPFISQPQGCKQQTGASRYIRLDGTLTVDIPYCFQNLFFLMEEGAKIIVEGAPGNKLEFANSELVGCESMWEGIIVKNSNQLSMNETLISDAFKAVIPENNSQISLKGNQFINNEYGIFIENSLTDVLLFENNLFTAESIISPLSGLKGIAGISISNAPGTTQFIGEGNIFTDMDNGLIAGDANFDIAGSRFLNFSRENQFQFAGYGIFAVNSKVDINNNEFQNCQTGIELNRASGDVLKNSIHGSENGIHSKYGGFLKINENQISAYQHAIHSDDDYLLGISNNPLIEVTGIEGEESKSYGIRIESPSKTLASVRNNIIIATSARNALAMRSGSYLSAAKNSVTNNHAENGHGILTSGINQIDLNCNSILGAGYYSRGIFDIDSKGNIECNKTIGSGMGVNVSGGIFGVEFKGNAMLNNSRYGLALSGGDIAIGQQEHHGNTWLGTGASHKGQLIDDSKFFIHTLDNGYYPTPPDPLDWFIPAEGVPFECPDPDCGLNLNIPELPDLPDFPDVEECEEFTELDRKVADGTFETAGIREGNLWSAEKGLLEKIRIPCIGNPPEFPEIDDFETQHEYSELGQLLDIESGIQDLRVLSEDDEQALKSVQTNLDNELTVWRDLGVQLSDADATKSEVQSLSTQRENAFALIEQLQTQLTGIKESVEQQNIQTAGQLLAENNIITTSSAPAENEKQVNGIYLQTLAIGNDEFTEEQLNTLLAIAAQCPQDGGDGVYRARALYAYSVPGYAYNDETCEAVEFRRNGIPDKESLIGLELRPNPASTEVQISFTDNAQFKGKVSIVNFLGETMSEYEKEVETNRLNADISAFDSGLYFIQVWINGKVVRSEKLSVIK